MRSGVVIRTVVPSTSTPVASRISASPAGDEERRRAVVDLELVERARTWVAIRSPSAEPRRMAEAVAVEPVVCNLGYALEPDGNPVVRHVRRPSPGGALQPPERARLDQEPFGPRMLLERDGERRQLVEERPPRRLGERADDADVADTALVVE